MALSKCTSTKYKCNKETRTEPVVPVFPPFVLVDGGRVGGNVAWYQPTLAPDPIIIHLLFIFMHFVQLHLFQFQILYVTVMRMGGSTG